MEYIKKVTQEIINKILSKGVKDMPQNPSAQGLTAAQIREFYYAPEKMTLELIAEIENAVAEAFNQIPTDDGYSKEYIDGIVNGIAEQIANRYTKEETYSAKQIDEKIANVGVVDLNIENGTGKNGIQSKGSYATMESAVAIGNNNRADAKRAVALGNTNTVSAYIPQSTKPTFADAISSGKHYYIADNKFVLIDTNLSQSDYDSIETIYEYNEIAGNSSFALGRLNKVYGNGAGAFGVDNIVYLHGGSSFAFGEKNFVNSYRSLFSGKENKDNTSGGEYNYVFGFKNEVSKNDNFINGRNNISNTQFGIILGYYNTADGKTYALIHGVANKSKGEFNYLLGERLVTNYNYQTAFGKFNSNKEGNLLEIGNGTDENNRSNAFEVDNDGKVTCKSLSDGKTTKTIEQLFSGGGGSGTQLYLHQVPIHFTGFVDAGIPEFTLILNVLSSRSTAYNSGTTFETLINTTFNKIVSLAFVAEDVQFRDVIASTFIVSEGAWILKYIQSVLKTEYVISGPVDYEGHKLEIMTYTPTPL